MTQPRDLIISWYYAPEQQFLFVSGQAARQHPPVEYAYSSNHLMSQFLPTLYVWRVEDLLGRFPLFPCWTKMQPQLFQISKAADRTTLPTAAVLIVQALACWWAAMFMRSMHGCGTLGQVWAAPASRVWPLCGQNWEASKEVQVQGFQARMGNLEGLHVTSHGICIVYTWYIPGIYLAVKHAFWVHSSVCPEIICYLHVYTFPQICIASLKICKT